MTPIFPASDRGLRIKICGITCASDAETAIACGADALGFNFYRGSKRYVDHAAAREWLAKLPRNVVKVALLVNPTLDEAIAFAEQPYIDALQLHGEETPEFCATLAGRGIRFIKAVPVETAESVMGLERFATDAILLDSRSEGFGGSGKCFDWALGAELVRNCTFDVWLAGGLTCANVADAVALVRPFGVDVTTGVEAAPGRKSAEKIQAFVVAARAAAA